MSAKASGADSRSNGDAKSRAHHDGSSGRAFTVEQKAAVIRIKQCSPTAFYKILGLEEVKTTCSDGDIKKAYRKLSLLTHPDKNGYDGADEAFKRTSTVYWLWRRGAHALILRQWYQEPFKSSLTQTRKPNLTALVATQIVAFPALRLGAEAHHPLVILRARPAHVLAQCSKKRYRPRKCLDSSLEGEGLLADPLVCQLAVICRTSWRRAEHDF
jgi:hypothetical protein